MLDLLFNRTPIWLFGVGTFLLLCLVAEAGFRLQQRLDRPASAEELRRGGVGQILGVTLGLMSLLLSFTFSIAVARHEARRALVVSEANAIGTTWLRADMAAEPYRTALEQTLRSYVQVRVGFYEAEEDEAKLDAVARQTDVLQHQLWAITGQVARSSANTGFSTALMQSMNAMFDQAPAQKAALAAHVPIAVLATLSVLLLAGALMLGATLGDLGHRHVVLSLMTLAVLAATMTLIIDIDRPRQTQVRVNPGAMLDLRQTLLASAEES